MNEAIRFSQKLGGALLIELTSTTADVAVLDRGALTVPAIEQSPGRWIVDDTYLDDVQAFVASVKKPPRPQYVRFDEVGAMVPAPKTSITLGQNEAHGWSEDDKSRGMKP